MNFLLFYCRKIFIYDGHNLPVLLGMFILVVYSCVASQHLATENNKAFGLEDISR